MRTCFEVEVLDSSPKSKKGEVTESRITKEGTDKEVEMRVYECTVCVWLLQLKSVFLLAHISISELVCLYSHLIF